ncbi:MAG: 3-isopropylmalate dehydratase small subunit [Bacteroidota bacterium]
MPRIEAFAARAVPLPINDIDTDQIIPARFLKGTERSGLGGYLFADLRLDAAGSPVPTFALNRPEHQGAEILLAGANFGCGSSREHAAWALADHGFRAVVSSSFADIFYSNALKNGILPVAVDKETQSALFKMVEMHPQQDITVDLPRQEIRWPGGSCSFQIDAFTKTCLLNGVDEMGYIMGFSEAIDRYEVQDEEARG